MQRWKIWSGRIVQTGDILYMQVKDNAHAGEHKQGEEKQNQIPTRETHADKRRWCSGRGTQIGKESLV